MDKSEGLHAMVGISGCAVGPSLLCCTFLAMWECLCPGSDSWSAAVCTVCMLLLTCMYLEPPTNGAFARGILQPQHLGNCCIYMCTAPKIVNDFAAMYELSLRLFNPQ